MINALTGAQHDLQLLMVAGIVCLLGSVTTLRLFQRAWATTKITRLVWLAIAAAAGGCAVWSTHFLATLAYDPGVIRGYEPLPTALSLVIAIIIPGLGFAAALAPGKRSVAIGGIVAGCGYALMLYIGMDAIQFDGHILWNPYMVAISVLLSIGFTGLALAAASHRAGNRGLTSGAFCFGVGILLLHVLGMAAMHTIADPGRVLSPDTIQTGTLGVAIAASSLFMLTTALLCVVFDRRLEDRKVQEALRLRAFANAAVEGIVICEGDLIRDVNASFETMIGRRADELAKIPFAEVVATRQIGDVLDDLNIPVETDLITLSGELIPVELVARDVAFQSTMRRVYAVRDLRERRSAERRIHHMAFHDHLTGLPNRSRFLDEMHDRVSEAKARGAQIAVLCLDLDRFKEINDVFGHPVGDALLRTLAERWEDVILPGEMLARLGGDEFVIVQSGIAQPEGSEHLAERLLAAVNSEVGLDQNITVRTATSIGIAIFPQDGTTSAQLHANADAALYRAKQEGRGTYRFFEAEMDLKRRERRALQADMARALSRGEFYLHYQPQAGTSTGVITGFEALLRWNHPTRGEIMPTTFIPLAEETGFIIQLGEFVLREACAEAASWEKELNIAVNLSPVQFRHGDIAQMVQRVLAETDLRPNRLELEITEGVLFQDFERALSVLDRIKELGVGIAMDDFGTGYSSLSYLQTFPFDRIKIDRSFIQQVNSNQQSEAIVRAIISLSRGLALPVTAEGVETEEQHAFLASLDCEEIQGFLIGSPQPIELFAAVVGTRRKRLQVRAA